MGTQHAGTPSSLTVQHEKAQDLLHQYRDKGTACLGFRGGDVFQLMDAFFGEGGSSSSTKFPPEDLKSSRHVTRRLSSWLSRVNTRVVARHLECAAKIGSRVPRFVDLSMSGATEVVAAAVETRLKAVYHYLTANAVHKALQELNAAAADADAPQAVYFDRLAALIASCGGATSVSSERRKALRAQLDAWKWKGVPDLMGPSLWRIYSLLAGDLNEVVGDTLEWHTAFGMYLWYRAPRDDSGGTKTPDPTATVVDAVRYFDEAVQQHGSACSFRPVPSYASNASASDLVSARAASRSGSVQSGGLVIREAEPEPYDLQFNVIRTAAKLLHWEDIGNFDYCTYSPRPLDVACSWHFSVLLLAVLGPASALKPQFQLLTQQYCLALELCGCWDWAIYVALFVSDSRARALLVRGLLLRNAGVLRRDMEFETRSFWPDVPVAWLLRAQGLRCEAMQDWPTAVRCWARSDGDALEHALAVAAAFLVEPALLRHVRAPEKRGATEAIVLSRPRPEARWLLGVLKELKASMSSGSSACQRAWTVVGEELLHFMSGWFEATAGQQAYRTEPQRMASLCLRCDVARRHLVGMAT